MQRSLITLTIMLVLLAAGASACLRLQSDSPKVIGVLIASDIRQSKIDGLSEGLERYGFLPGKNVKLVVRNAREHPDQLPELARELAALRPDVIVAMETSEALAAKEATAQNRIPVVFVGVGLPIEVGLVTDLAHPGGNITGVDNYYVQLSGKRLEHFQRPEYKAKVAKGENPYPSKRPWYGLGGASDNQALYSAGPWPSRLPARRRTAGTVRWRTS